MVYLEITVERSVHYKSHIIRVLKKTDTITSMLAQLMPLIGGPKKSKDSSDGLMAGDMPCLDLRNRNFHVIHRFRTIGGRHG